MSMEKQFFTNRSVKCGICNDLVSRTLNKKHFYCSSCISFRLLKYNLNKINIECINEGFVQSVDRVLESCINGHAEEFLSLYVGNIDDLEVKQKLFPLIPEKELNVSIDSVARLAYILLTVERSQRIINIQMVDKHLQDQIVKNQNLKAKIEMLSNEVENRQKNIKNMNKMLDLHHSRDTNSLVDDYTQLKNTIVRNQSRLIKHEKTRLILNLIQFWNIERLEQNSLKLSILFTPIISIDLFIFYTMDLITVSLDRAARFAKKIAGYLQIQLPFPIKNDEKGLSVGSVNSFEFNNIETLFDMNRKQLLSFCIGLSNLIMDILKILKHVKPEHDLGNIKLMDLLQIDQLLILIISHYSKFETFQNKSCLQEDLLDPIQSKQIQNRNLVTDIFKFWKTGNDDKLQKKGIVKPHLKKISNPFNAKYYSMYLESNRVDFSYRSSKLLPNSSLSLSQSTVPASYPDVLTGMELISDVGSLSESIYHYFTQKIPLQSSSINNMRKDWEVVG